MKLSQARRTAFLKPCQRRARRPRLAAHFAAEFASVETTDDFAAERLIKDALAIRSTLAAATGLAMSVKQRAVLGDGGMIHNLSSGALDGSISIKGF